MIRPAIRLESYKYIYLEKDSEQTNIFDKNFKIKNKEECSVYDSF